LKPAMFSMRDRFCLITGSTRGLGAVLTRVFWESGANLLLVARNAEDLDRQVASLGSKPGQTVLRFAADLENPNAAREIIDAARSRAPRLHVLINNAAVQGPIGPLWQNDWSRWLEAVQVDLVAPAALCHAAIPWMIESGGGSIINLSGGGASGPRPNFSAYATAKSGLVRFSETLAQELLTYNISVNCIAPGAMSTTMLDEVARAGAEASGASEYNQAVKIRREGGASLQNVADLCLFLTSPAARGITGKLISAAWDPWPTLLQHCAELAGSDVYTLRRIVPQDRGLAWGADR
jgi:NAD(P)-dependent dehydrogenase (short-subunit alcohol dehydrogenase family)